MKRNKVYSAIQSFSLFSLFSISTLQYFSPSVQLYIFQPSIKNMSKRELKKYLHVLKKAELEEQMVDLYERFPNVKEYYNFVFNPNEKKLTDEAKQKISKEYFPLNGRKPKGRRSVAQKLFKHFISLGVDVPLIADLMLFNLEIAQTYSAEYNSRPEAFYKSMLSSFNQTVEFILKNGYFKDYRQRINSIANKAEQQKWMNRKAFFQKLEDVELTFAKK